MKSSRKQGGNNNGNWENRVHSNGPTSRGRITLPHPPPKTSRPNRGAMAFPTRHDVVIRQLPQPRIAVLSALSMTRAAIAPVARIAVATARVTRPAVKRRIAAATLPRGRAGNAVTAIAMLPTRTPGIRFLRFAFLRFLFLPRGLIGLEVEKRTPFPLGCIPNTGDQLHVPRKTHPGQRGGEFTPCGADAMLDLALIHACEWIESPAPRVLASILPRIAPIHEGTHRRSRAVERIAPRRQFQHHRKMRNDRPIRAGGGRVRPQRLRAFKRFLPREAVHHLRRGKRCAVEHGHRAIRRRRGEDAAGTSENSP